MLLAAPALATEFYVAPGASASGTGSFSNPWRLQTALNHPAAVQPGDTIWLRGGTYAGQFTNYLDGTSGAPIIVRQYPGERATLDGGASNTNTLTLVGTYTWFWGFEIMSSSTDRTSNESTSWPSDMLRGDGVAVSQSPGNGTGTKLINLVIHDTRQGVGFWSEAIGAEIHGCLIYYNGWSAPDRAHGHGIYIQNQTGTKKITNNIVFSGFAYGLHAYGGAAYLDNLQIEDNILFSSGITTHGREPNFLLGSGDHVALNLLFDGNLLYHRLPGGPSGGLWTSYSGCTGADFTNNYVAGNVILQNCASGLLLTGNTFYYNSFSGLNPLSYPGNTFTTSRPTGVQVFVRPNSFESGRANIAVYNWALAATTSVNLSAFLSPGTAFEIRNAQDFFGAPVLSGVYAGGNVVIPIGALSVAAPVGFSAPSPSGPEFNAFVVLPVSGAPAPTPTATVPAPTSTPTRTPTSPPPTATRTPTSVPPTATRTPTSVPPTATRTPTGVPPTATRTPTGVPPTATRTPTGVPPTATRTPTGVPPTATRTPTNVPPTATRTPTGVPPTATRTPTSVPPTATPTRTRTPIPPPPTATRTPTPANRVVRTLEAESGSLTSPMAIGTSTAALGGRYIATATANSGLASWSFSVPTGGNYVVWARVQAPNSSADSFFVHMDAAAEDIYDVAEGTQGPPYQWSRVNGRNGTPTPRTIDPRIFSLTAGNHTLHFRGREPGTRLDRLVVTNDLSYVPTTGDVQSFSDVPVGHPFYEFIETAAARGLASGCGPGIFCPDASTTRAQMSVLLLRAEHGPTFTPPPATGTVFSDVSAGSFAAAWIERLAAEGITSGCGNGRYCPSAPVTRDQMSVFLLRTRWGTGFSPPSATGMFQDVSVQNGFARWVEELVREQISGGCAPSLYCPQQPATRGQMAVLLVAAFGLA
jgi:hypothetical protein